MKRRFTAILLVMALALTSFLQPLSVQAEGETEAKNYSVITPAGYDDDHSYPVVYVLPQDGFAQDNSGLTEKLQAAMADGTAAEMIIVKPQFTKWNDKKGEEPEDIYATMEKIIAEVDEKYNTIADKDYRAVVGTGVGGYLAYILGLTEAVEIKAEPEAPAEGEEAAPEAQAEEATPEESETVTEYLYLTAPKNFKYIASTRGDFVSSSNAWYSVYGDVLQHMKDMDYTVVDGDKKTEKTYLTNGFYTYLDTPVDDSYADMTGSTHDIGQHIINSGSSDCEFTTRLGSFTDEFFTESVNRIARRLTDGVLSDAVSGTVALKDTVLSSTASTFEVDYTVATTDAIADFSKAAENMEITVDVIDPSTDEVLASKSVEAAVAAETKGTLELDKKINGTSANVVLSVKLLGAKFELATATALSVRETKIDGDYQLIDLMGDWNFHYLQRSAGLQGWDAVKDAVTSGAYKDWSVVQPGLAWWTMGFGDLISNMANWPAYADYGFIGEGWYVREFDLPANTNVDDLILSIGNLDDRGQVYINGKLVGETGMVDGKPNGESAWEEYSYFKIEDPSVLNVGGKNTIAVMCYNDGTGGGGWYSGPVALYSQEAFEADDSTVSYFKEYSFESEYAASAQGEKGTVENKYLIALPESYDENPDKYYPTVYLMHQYNSTHKSYMTDDVDRLLRNAAKSGLLDEMIIVVPNSHENSWWRGDWMKMVSEELVPLIDSEYRTIKDARYRFTAGCSMGGQGAFGVALQNPDLFSGAVSFFGAFSMGGDASPNKIVQNESAEYMSNFAMYFICGNQDIYQFGDPAVELHQQLLAKDVDHEMFIENGGHDSTFYLPHFVEGIKYARDNMYKASDAVVEQLDGTITASGSTVKVNFEAANGINKYFNSIPASSYTKDTTPDLNVTLKVSVEQNGKVVYEVVERDFAISKNNKSELFKYNLGKKVKADEEYTVTLTASIFDKSVVLDKETVNEPEIGSVKLSYTKLGYTGSKRVPAVKVTDENGKALKSGTDYKVAYYNEAGKKVTSPTSVGKYTVKVTFIGKYADCKAKNLSYTIVPKPVTNLKATAPKAKTIKVSWKKSTGADGYYVYYKKSTASKYSNYKLVTGTSVTFSNLAKNTKYNFKVVPYCGANKVKSVSSTVVSAKTLK